jgi:DNA-binding PadR family transcriptional regulator
MAEDVKLTHTSALILQTISAGFCYGFDIMEATGLPSGTVYPALRRLEQSSLIKSKWEKDSVASAELRPARKYYKLTGAGDEALARATKRYPLLQHLAAGSKPERS